MNILYVSYLFTPLEELLTGSEKDTSIPSFRLPLLKLVSLGHNVDFITCSTKDFFVDVKLEGLKNQNLIKKIVYSNKNLGGKLKCVFQQLVVVLKTLFTRKYDFIYCHGSQTFISTLVAFLLRVPCAHRLYGIVDFYDCLVQKGKAVAFIKDTQNYLSFLIPKSFLLVTEDGSRGKEAYKLLRIPKSRYRFECWTNGTEFKIIGDILNSGPVPVHTYIFHAARVCPIKRQDRIIEVLHLLHLRGNLLHLYFAGAWENEEDFCYYWRVVQKYHLENYVHFMGAISKDYLRNMAYHAVATVLMGDVSNKGNVFLEIFSIGGTIMSIDDGSLDEYIINEKNGFLIQNELEACEKIEELLKCPETKLAIQIEALKTAKEKIVSWDERIQKEIQLIMDTVN